MQRQTGAAVDQLNTNVVQQNMQTQALTMLGMRIPNNENVTYELMPSNTGIVD